jgi:hypothetical protein
MMSRSMAVIVAAVLYAGLAARAGAPTALDDFSWWGAAVRVNDALPPGHPPIPSQRLPEGHPPIAPAYPALPEGHPPIPWLRHGCPGGGFDHDFGDSDGLMTESPEVVST